VVAAYIALFISLVCVIFLIVILFKVKNKFETGNILEKSQIYMEKMVADMNKNAMRDIDIVNQNSKQLRELILQAENTINSFNEATDRLRSMIGEAEKLNVSDNAIRQALQPERPVHYAENKNVAPLKTVSQRNKESLANKYKTNSTPVDPNATYQVTAMPDGQPVQKSLFDNTEEIKVTNDGAAYKEVPVIHTRILDERPASTNYIDISHSRRSLSDKVNELFAKGYPVEEIARQLSCSVTEVQTIIDLGI